MNAYPRILRLAALSLTLPLSLSASAQTKPAETKPADVKPAETKQAPAKAAEKAVEEKQKMTGESHPVVVMKTSLGEIEIKLNRAQATATVDNFLQYVDDKFFDGTIFHRVIENFMIQGGGFTADMGRKETRAAIPIDSQNGLKNTRGTIAMARTNDPNSATSQFFINVVDNANLDYPKPDGHGYTVFGEVTKGMDVVDKIRAVKTTVKNGMRDVPVDSVLIESVRRAGAAAKAKN